MNKYVLLSYQLIAPWILFNILDNPFHEFISDGFLLEAQVIDNQAELHFGDNQKKTSEKPKIQIKEEKKHSEKKEKKFDKIDNIISILENAPYLIEKDTEESVLGMILFNLSGTVLYGLKTENIY